MREDVTLTGENSTDSIPAAEVKSERQRWTSWLSKGALAVADQGIFALSNFLLNVLLARWLTGVGYGAFALAYSVFLSLLLVHNALFTTPMLVFGQGKYRDRFAEYLGVLLRGHFLLAGTGSVLLVLAAWVMGRMYGPSMLWALLALALAAPFILLLWLLRRAFYARLDPVWAAFSGFAYLVTVLAGVTVLHSTARLSPASGFLLMAAASLVTSGMLLLRLRPALTRDPALSRAVAADHWRYGKWVAAGAVPNWFTDNIYFLVLPAWGGLADAGAMKAVLNLAQPAAQSISALGVLLMPILVRERQNGGMPRVMRASTAFLIAGAAVYAVLLWFFSGPVMHSLYAGKFAAYGAWPILAVGLVPIAQVLPNVAGAAVGAIEKPKLGFWADSWSAAFALVVGIPLAIWLHIGGALLGTALSYTVMGVLTLALFLRAVKREAARTGRPRALQVSATGREAA